MRVYWRCLSWSLLRLTLNYTNKHSGWSLRSDNVTIAKSSKSPSQRFARKCITWHSNPNRKPFLSDYQGRMQGHTVIWWLHRLNVFFFYFFLNPYIEVGSYVGFFCVYIYFKLSIRFQASGLVSLNYDIFYYYYIIILHTQEVVFFFLSFKMFIQRQQRGKY